MLKINNDILNTKKTLVLKNIKKKNSNNSKNSNDDSYSNYINNSKIPPQVTYLKSLLKNNIFLYSLHKIKIPTNKEDSDRLDKLKSESFLLGKTLFTVYAVTHISEYENKINSNNSINKKINSIEEVSFNSLNESEFNQNNNKSKNNNNISNKPNNYNSTNPIYNNNNDDNNCNNFSTISKLTNTPYINNNKPNNTLISVLDNIKYKSLLIIYTFNFEDGELNKLVFDSEMIQKITIGRKQCDVIMYDSYLSRNHGWFSYNKEIDSWEFGLNNEDEISNKKDNNRNNRDNIKDDDGKERKNVLWKLVSKDLEAKNNMKFIHEGYLYTIDYK